MWYACHCAYHTIITLLFAIRRRHHVHSAVVQAFRKIGKMWGKLWKWCILGTMAQGISDSSTTGCFSDGAHKWFIRKKVCFWNTSKVILQGLFARSVFLLSSWGSGSSVVFFRRLNVPFRGPSAPLATSMVLWQLHSSVLALDRPVHKIFRTPGKMCRE